MLLTHMKLNCKLKLVAFTILTITVTTSMPAASWNIAKRNSPNASVCLDLGSYPKETDHCVGWLVDIKYIDIVGYTLTQAQGGASS